MDKRNTTEKNTVLDKVLSILLLIIFLLLVVLLAKWIFSVIGDMIINFVDFISGFVDSTDKVIVVAMISGTVSIVGVVISSIVSKIVDYRYNVKRYLVDKKENAYQQFIEMVFRIVLDTKKKDDEKISEGDALNMISELSKGLALWGSNKVVRKYLDFRKSSLIDSNPNKYDTLFRMEEIIYEIRKDIGMEHKLKRGEILSLFINDIEKAKDEIKK